KAALTPEERLAFMRAVYQLAEDIVSVTWLDADARELAPRVLLDVDAAKSAPGRIAASAEQQAAVNGVIAKLLALPMKAHEALLSEPLAVLGRRLPSLVLMVCADEACESRIAVEVALRAAEGVLTESVAGSPLHAALVAKTGDVLMHAGAGSPLGKELDPSR